MGHSGYDLTAATGGDFRKQGGCNLPGHVGKGIAVEEEKRSAAMAMPEEFYGFVEREELPPFLFPLAAARCLSLSIKAVLRASSCARSSIEADDKLPTPVLEKSGSGL
jgi:hypothetical protein